LYIFAEAGWLQTRGFPALLRLLLLP
jgi:hypothetical protein